MSDPRQFTGTVVKRPFASGSKSEREAVMLTTREGDYVLRRQGGNPFRDPALEKLVGRRVRCSGVVSGYTLLASEITALPDG